MFYRMYLSSKSIIASCLGYMCIAYRYQLLEEEGRLTYLLVQASVNVANGPTLTTNPIVAETDTSARSGSTIESIVPMSPTKRKSWLEMVQP